MTGLGKDPVTGRCDRKVGRCDRENMTPRALLLRAKNHIIIFVPRLDSRALCKIEARVKRLGLKG